jgi:hypothetical protein
MVLHQTHIVIIFFILFFSGTSVCLSPSGNFLWAGFSDGTMRVFDVGGGFGFQQDSVPAPYQKSHMLLVASKCCQSAKSMAAACIPIY